MQNEPDNWSLVCHLDYGDSGAVAVIDHAKEETTVRHLPRGPASGADAQRRPVFLGVTADQRPLMLDPVGKSVEVANALPEDATALYGYAEAGSARVWFTNDGDKETGNDALNCGDQGASMTVVESQGAASAAVLQTICVGRGHHVPTFTAPSADHPDVPRRAYVSNLQDGTISVIGNDPQDRASYLSVIETINLCEPEKEEGGEGLRVPNNAFPHGKVYSGVTGRIYGLNNGYKTIAVIDPLSNRIEERIDFKVASNLLLSPDGRFIIGKGADRKTDPEHVLGRLTVMDAVSREANVILDLKDVYPSTYRFNPDGSKLYVTTAATGKGGQRDNLRKDVVLVYDTSRLPEIALIKEVEVGTADCGRRPIAFLAHQGRAHRVFVPNPTDGTVSVLDAELDICLETLEVSDRPVEELNFSLLGAANIYGC